MIRTVEELAAAETQADPALVAAYADYIDDLRDDARLTDDDQVRLEVCKEIIAARDEAWNRGFLAQVYARQK